MKNKLTKHLNSLILAEMLMAWSSYGLLDNGIDPANLGKGDWVVNVATAVQQANSTHPSIVTSPTDLAGFMELERNLGVQYIVVKAGGIPGNSSSGSTPYPSAATPQFTADLVNKAHEKCLKIFGYTRASQNDIPGQIALAATVNNTTDVHGKPADGFVIDAEADWETASGPANATQLCSGIKAQFPTRFLAHAPLPIIHLHSSFPYKEFGKYCDVVMPQAYWQAWVGRSFCGGIVINGPQGMVDTLDCEWTAWQNSLDAAHQDSIKPIVPLGWGCNASISSASGTVNPTTADIENFINNFAADPHPATSGGYHGALFFTAGPLSGDRHLEVWTGIGNGFVSQPMPDPYIGGGYASADIILEDTSNPGAVPYGTPLIPNHPYAFSATVHNSSPTAANVTVRFWEFPGGVGSAGTLIASVPAVIPGNSIITVRSPVDFQSASPGQHKCAVVTLALTEGCARCPDATIAAQVPDPNANIAHSCSAWRNTDSQTIPPPSGGGSGSGPGGGGGHRPPWSHQPWKLNLEINWPKPTPHPHGPGPDPGPEGVSLAIETRYIPRDWERQPENARLSDILHKTGVNTMRKPLYLLPQIRQKLKVADLNLAIETNEKVKIEMRKTKIGKRFSLKTPPGRNLPFTVVGTLPGNARTGDTFLVIVTAHYPAWGGAPSRNVEFTEILHFSEPVKEGRKDTDGVLNFPH